MKQRTFLIADGNSSDSIELAHKASSQFKVFRVEDVDYFQGSLNDPTGQFSAIFFNPGFLDPLGIPLVRMCLEHHPTTPIFYILDQPIPAQKLSLLQSLPIQAMVHKPFELSSFVSNLEKKEKSSHATYAEVKTPNSEDSILRVTLESLSLKIKSTFDLYVQMKSKRQLQVLKKNEIVDLEVLERDFKDQIEFFFILKQDLNAILEKCDRATAELIIENSDIGLGNTSSLKPTLEVENHILHFLLSKSIDEKAVESSRKFVAKIREQAEKIKKEKHGFPESFFSNLISKEHSYGVTMVTSLLVGELGFENERRVEMAGLAGFLHDLSLTSLPDRFKEEDMALMNSAEREEFMKHPAQSAKMLEPIRSIDQTLLQAISQHHERRNKKGFPQKLGPGQISILGQVVGISEEFIDLLKKKSRTPHLDLEYHLKHAVFDGFDSKVVEAFKKVMRII